MAAPSPPLRVNLCLQDAAPSCRCNGFSTCIGWFADAVISARLADLGTEFDFFQEADYLAFTKF
jgi:hypothetical protein